MRILQSISGEKEFENLGLAGTNVLDALDKFLKEPQYDLKKAEIMSGVTQGFDRLASVERRGTFPTLRAHSTIPKEINEWLSWARSL
jgi:hypothetical protein